MCACVGVSAKYITLLYLKEEKEDLCDSLVLKATLRDVLLFREQVSVQKLKVSFQNAREAWRWKFTDNLNLYNY